MNENNYLVTCVIPTHNRSQLLKNAIESVLKQTYKDIELIIVDDASTDDTEFVIKNYIKHHNNIFYFKLNQPKGACFARNLGIKKARGKFISGLDDDDIWLNDRIEKMLESYDSMYSFIYSESYKKKSNKIIVEKRQPFVSFKEMLKGENLCGTQILVEKERILKLNGFDTSLPASQDYDMWLRLLKHYGIAKCVNEPLMVRDTSDRLNRISVNKWKVFKGKYRVYKKYKDLMDENLKKERIYYIRKILHNNPSLKFILNYCPNNNKIKEIRRFLKYKIKTFLYIK